MHVRTMVTAGRTTGGFTGWGMLVLLSAAELLGMSLWFTASAVASDLAEVWSLSAAQAGWLTTIVQLGFVAGTAVAAVMNATDVLPLRFYVAGAAACAAGSNLMLLVAPTFMTALLLRFGTGFFLAGVYPPAMKMIATWFAPAGGATNTQRGLAIGTVVGALTVGKALPYLLRTFENLTYRDVLVWGSVGAFVAALLVLIAYRDGPFAFPKRPFSWQLAGVVLRHRETRLAIGGYLGHMWELYACWALVAAFFFDFFQYEGATAVQATARSGAVAFGAIAAGGLGSVLAGRWADRLGRERITIWSMAVSGICAW